MESRPREEEIRPRSLAESEAQLETLLMNTGSWSWSSSPPALLLPHTKTKTKSWKTAAGQRSHLPVKAQGVRPNNLQYSLEAGCAGQTSLHIVATQPTRISC